MENPKVSIITGTWNREAFLPAILDCVRWQTYDNIEWLVLDDSDEPSETLQNCGYDKLTYIYSKDRVTLGEKRNRMIAQATGEIIVNFDDDDFYGPNYVANRVQALLASGQQLSLMAGFFAYQMHSGHFGYYRTRVKQGPAYHFHKQGVKMVDLGQLHIPLIHLCFGWAFVYRKSLWDLVKFQDITMFEDRQFTQAALQHTGVHYYESRSVDAVHGIHNLSSSNCFPQFIIPPFMMSLNGPRPRQHLNRLSAIIKAQNAAKQAEPALEAAAAETP